MAVVCYMLVLVTAGLDHNTRMGILFTTIIVFAFRATPTVGDGYFWWTLDELNFDASFYGTLRQTGAILSIAVMWMFSRQLTEASVTKTLLWLSVAGTVLSSQYRADLRRAPMDRSRIWLWCPQYRHRRCRGIHTVCAAQHGTATYLDRLLCTAQPSCDLVRADGLVDEHRGGGVTAADEIPQ